VAAGTPEDVTKVKESYTGAYLRELLGAAMRERKAAE
jgi:excinuclease UvrABC ATPase subunit